MEKDVPTLCHHFQNSYGYWNSDIISCGKIPYMGNLRGRKLSWFGRNKIFVEKTFMDCSLVSLPKVFSLESFPLYGTAVWLDHTHCIMRQNTACIYTLHQTLPFFVGNSLALHSGCLHGSACLFTVIPGSRLNMYSFLEVMQVCKHWNIIWFLVFSIHNFWLLCMPVNIF